MYNVIIYVHERIDLSHIDECMFEVSRVGFLCLFSTLCSVEEGLYIALYSFCVIFDLVNEEVLIRRKMVGYTSMLPP